MEIIDTFIDLLTGGFKRLNDFGGGRGVYSLLKFDLGKIRTNKLIYTTGDQLIVTDCEDQAYVRLNDETNPLIPLQIVRQVNSPFRKFYLTNAASAGKTLKILVGSGGIFKCNFPQLIDIIRCNYGNLPIDIQANTIGNLPIDIKAATVGNLDIDLNAQSVGDLDINLNAQNLDRIVIRDQDGGAESSQDASRVIAGGGTEYDFVDISGKGSLRWFYIHVSAKAGSTNIHPRIYLDGTLLHPDYSFGNWNVVGADANTTPFAETVYNPGGFNAGHYYFEKGIVFDTSLKLSAYNADVASQTVTCNWFYQEI